MEEEHQSVLLQLLLYFFLDLIPSSLLKISLSLVLMPTIISWPMLAAYLSVELRR